MTEQERQRFKEAYTQYLPLPADTEPELGAALVSILHNPGSLVRPQVVLGVSLAYGFALEHATELAIALEYFHTASLLFDDLPSMDHAVERRGRPCVYVEFGEASAVLSALALINRAYALVWKAVAECVPECRARALAFLERYLGVDGLVNGQSMDLHHAGRSHTWQSTRAIALRKTVPLFRLTLVLPAMLGNAPERELQLLDRIAIFWGLSYQIVDDLKDVLEQSAASGKTTSRDQLLDRPNMALVLGTDAAAQRLTRFVRVGDRVTARLVRARPAMRFLESVRDELSQEALRVVQPAVHAVGVGGG